ncbi:AarF/UbiB family protein [Microtetraspora sp. NBRC 16547]|uniref:ABC1 kinase family protein n=1 Tax=Microtetraspora sp. NBRC 16547 TaxID=3030993 RepID=UPI0024A1E645|nr:AarF/UbiB family protein [Microtetraspora sp. NBRC 16547]GLW98165.1 ubiquinone biosynthesis protein UbiB [Microtetraspora sp. NBRC 16547]
MPPSSEAFMDIPLTLTLSFGILVMIIALAVAARRLLGVRFGAIRTALAAFMAFSLAGPLLSPVMMSFASTAEKDDPGIGPLWVMVLAVMCVVLIPMVILVVAEALVPPGSIPGPIEFARSLRGRISRARRYSQITRIAFRHGLGPYLRGRGARLDDRSGRVRLARALRGALEDGGVTFVKLGQVLSTRRDLLPAEFVDELGKLQDHVAPAPWEQIEQVLVAELGGPVDEIFAEFTRRPLAAASIAQAYTARLHTGESVVVKVQRPAIRVVVAQDLDIVARLAHTLETRTRWGRALGLRDLAEGFAVAIREELDFRIESGNMAAVAVADSGGGTVTYPSPYAELCTERVLVMQRLTGGPLSGATREQGPELARTLLDCLLRQILLEGVFHADPHPGNIMLLTDGTLGLLDFGSVGRLDASVRAALQRFLIAMNRQDPLGVTDALLDVVPRPEEIDDAALERAMGQFMARHLAPGTGSMLMFTDLFRIVTEYGLSIPPEVAAVFRALATLEGTLVTLAPGFNLIDEARTFAGDYLAEQLDTTSVKDAVTHEIATLLPMLRRLPRRIERIASAAEHGRFSMNVRLLADERDRRFITGLLHQVLLTVLGATAGLMGVVLLGTDGGPRVIPGVISLYELIGFNLLVISSILVLRVLIGVFRRDRAA